MSNAILDSETIQSLTFIACCCVHQFLKSKKFQNCQLCLDNLTTDKDLLFDTEESPEKQTFRNLGLGVFEMAVKPCRRFYYRCFADYSNFETRCRYLDGVTSRELREILIETSIRVLQDTSSESWRNKCLNCNSDS